MKTIAIVAYEKTTAMPIKENLIEIFGNLVTIKWYFIVDGNISCIDADIVIFTSPTYYEMFQEHVKGNAAVVQMKRTITKEGYDKLKTLPSGTKAALYNVTLELALETISQINEAGIKNLKLIPAYNGLKGKLPVDIAVTPGETRVVPNGYNEVIDIGNRKLDLSTIMDISSILGLDYEVMEQRVGEYADGIIPLSHGLQDLLYKKKEINNVLNVLLNIYNKAIVAFDSDGNIINCNKRAQRLYDFNHMNNPDTFDVNNLLEKLYIKDVLISQKKRESQLIYVNKKDVIVNNYPIFQSNEFTGVVSIGEEFYEVEDNHQRIRKKIIQNSNRAKYSFEDIHGESFLIKKTIGLAKKIATGDSSIVIQGETGTGKELFAQAIHNYSRRKKHPFVAINCSALSAGLLEAELFGYEDGAFTGAKKGGSKGLFEAAHNGTLFLDEISELPIDFQSKLLRVIQEQEIRRVGSDKVISIDVRIICATNKDLSHMVMNNEFRKDLYYRLATFTMYLPDLCERREDIPLLANIYAKELEPSKTIPDDVLSVLKKI